MNIALLGGSFDPPHKSHMEMVRAAMEYTNSSKALLVPAGSHAFKGPNTTGKAHRLNMAKIAAKSVKNCFVSELEINREGVSYTVDTLKALKQEMPNDTFYFAIGSDVLFQLHLWRDFIGLSALTRFVCFIRQGTSPIDALRAAESLGASFDSHISIIDWMNIEGLSSTAIRANIIRGKEGLPSGVMDYIQENGLYSLENHYDLEH